VPGCERHEAVDPRAIVADDLSRASGRVPADTVAINNGDEPWMDMKGSLEEAVIRSDFVVVKNGPAEAKVTTDGPRALPRVGHGGSAAQRALIASLPFTTVTWQFFVEEPEQSSLRRPPSTAPTTRMNWSMPSPDRVVTYSPHRLSAA
jgi:hypothetical protein